MNRIQYFCKPELRDQAAELFRRGGPFKKAGEKVLALIELISMKDRNPLAGLTVTNNGESRIAKCVKYDLTGACRLVSVQDKNKVFLLCVGDHDTVDKWLDANRGKTFVSDDTGQVSEVSLSSSVPGERKGTTKSSYTPDPLYKLLPEEHFDWLMEGCTRATARKIEALRNFATDDEILDAIEGIDDKETSELVFDVIFSLKAGEVRKAIDRIRLAKGELKPLTEDGITASEDIIEIPQDDPRYAELFSHFIKTANYKQWMLFMHPEQQSIVNQDFNGPAKLLGISGSGKTCVVVKRAIRLAEMYQNEDVLVVTLNRSLSNLIKELVDTVALGSVARRIHVKPFFKLCQEYLHEYEPGSDKLYDDTTWKSLEHIDEVWTEYYRCELNNHDAEVMIPVHDYLIAQGVDAESYIREEFDWIRSAFDPSSRGQYLKIERSGRSIPLLVSYRMALLDGLEGWEKKMKAVGVTDYIGLASALSKHLDKLSPRYRCTLVDESQDFGNTELDIVRRITVEDTNDIFICGDAAQQISTKYQSLKSVGIAVPSANSKKLLKNYRNSKEILSAAYTVLNNYISTHEVAKSEDFEVLSPEYSGFSGPSPLLLQAESLGHELGFALLHAKEQIQSNPSWKVCIAICGYSLFELEIFARDKEISILNGNVSLDDNCLFLSDLEQAKGFEFDMMIVLNACENIIPNVNLPEKEHYRQICHLYVALTRAKSELVVSFHDKPSNLLEIESEVFLADQWSTYYPDQIPDVISPPQKINHDHFLSEDNLSVLFKTGPEFLYSTKAIGTSTLLIPKLRELISGTPLNSEGHRVKWRNLGSAYDSILTSPRSRLAFGLQGIKEFRALCNELGFEKMIRRVEKKNLYAPRAEVPSESIDEA